MSKLTYQKVALWYALLFLTLTWPFWAGGEVVAPHRQMTELAIGQLTDTEQLENRKFSDFSKGYIPEISEHLHGSRSGWLTLWTNKNELGRPIYHISGFSPAYPLSWLIAQVTTSPWLFITILSLSTCFIAGLFILLFCKEIGLTPWAGLIAGTSLAGSPLFMYWLTFPMFPAVWCWSAGVLWALSRLIKKTDLLGWSILSFSVYSLLMTAYPQPVVFHAYLLGGYGVYLAYTKWQVKRNEAVYFVSIALSALIVGAGLAFPVYRDLAIVAADSARVAPDPSFFTAVLPKFASFDEVLRFFVLSTVPEFFGNPISTAFPLPYDGLSVTLLVVFFAVIGVYLAFHHSWGWWLAIGILCLFAFVHPLYVLGVKFLGFNLSRSTPLGSIMLPLTIIVALGVDALVQRTKPMKVSKAVVVAVASILVVIVVGVIYGLVYSAPIRWGMVLLMLLMAGMLAAHYRKTRLWLIIPTLILVLATISYPLMLRQNPAQIATTSPLVERVKLNLSEGERFAVISPGISALPPNLNAGLGLSSIHSYNSLSSKRYHTLINALGGEVRTYGRWNGAIAPDYSSAMFWMSNISLVLSPTLLQHENLEYLGEESDAQLYKVVSRMGDSLQVYVPQLDMKAKRLEISEPRHLPTYISNKVLDEGDVVEYEVSQKTSSVLILSQKFHNDWQAQVLSHEGWKPAETSEINGVFQGVLIPESVERVRLEFKPFSHYAWIAHVVWFMLFAFLLCRVLAMKMVMCTGVIYKNE